MKLNYHADTESLPIDGSQRPSVDSREISEGVVADYDGQGRVVAIDIDNAGHKIDVERVLIIKLPGTVETGPGTYSSTITVPHWVGCSFVSVGRSAATLVLRFDQ